jgi:hypothetical protein
VGGYVRAVCNRLSLSGLTMIRTPVTWRRRMSSTITVVTRPDSVMLANLTDRNADGERQATRQAAADSA